MYILEQEGGMSLQIGDRIRRAGKVFGGLINHDAVVVDVSLYGASVVHNDSDKGKVVLVSFSEFAGDRPVFLVVRAKSLQEQEAIVQRALSCLGNPYGLLNFNSEHFANYAQSGVASSPQLQGATFIGLAVVAGLAIAFTPRRSA